MITKAEAAAAVRATTAGKERARLLNWLYKQTDEQLHQWLIEAEDGHETIVEFIKREADRNDEQQNAAHRSAAQLLRSPLPDCYVHPSTWKAAHTTGRIYKMKAEDVQHWEYVQLEAASSGEGGACSGNAGNGQQLLVDAICDHQDQADELYGRDLRLLRPQCVGSMDSEAEMAAAMASPVTGPHVLGALANAFLHLNRAPKGTCAIWRQQPPAAIIQGSMITGGPARPVYGQQAPAAGPAATAAGPATGAAAGSAASTIAGPAAGAAAGLAAGAATGPAATAGAGSAATANAGPAAAAAGDCRATAAAGSASVTAVVSAVVAPSTSTVDYRYKQDLLMTIEHLYDDVSSNSSGCSISADVGDIVTPQMVEPVACTGGSVWQGHTTESQDQQQQQQLLEATLAPPPCNPPQPRPMTAGTSNMQQQQQVAGDCQGGGGSTVGGSACFQQLEATVQVEAGPASKRRRVQPQCVCAGELKIISKLMVGKGQPLDLREAWRDVSHPQHAIAIAVLSQILTYMMALGICYGFISCWLATWLVYCPPAGADGCRRCLLYVSDPFLSTTSAMPAPSCAGGPSRVATVYGALAFLQWRALRCAVGLHEPLLQHMGMDMSPTGMGPATDGGGGAGGGDADSGSNYSSAKESDTGAHTGSNEEYIPTQSELEQASDSYHQLQGSLQQLGRQGTVAAEPAGPMVAAQQRQPQQMPVAAAPGMVADSAVTPSATAAAAAATAAAANLPQPPCVLLRFSETLTAGSEGLVMAGTCDGVDCVIKLLGPDLSGLAAYEREVAVYAALQHLQGRHVPELQAWGDLEYGVRFLALRRVAGAQPLSSLQRPLPVAVVGAALQALEVVQAACPGFIHGDVRLENMVVLLEAAASDGFRGEQQLQAGLAGPSTSQPAGASAGAGDEARVGLAAGAASSGSLLLPRCVLLDFGRSRLDGDAVQQRLEREELRQLLR